MTPALKGFVYKPSPRPGAALGEGWGKEPALPLTPTPPAGGMVTSGLAIYDTMQYILNPICTWCVGQAASMGSLLLAAGTPGMRHSLPNSRIMIHQPSGGARVSAVRAGCFGMGDGVWTEGPTGGTSRGSVSV